MYKIAYSPEVVDELRPLRVFDRRSVLVAVDRHLKFDALAGGNSRKRVELDDGRVFHQLRVGDFRIFYSADQSNRTVVIRHIRYKGRKTTSEIL